MMVTVLTVVFCDGTLSSLVGRYRCFGGICCMFLQNVSIHLQHYPVLQSRNVTLTNEYTEHICENYSEKNAAFMNIAEVWQWLW
jgi:hypothetical protein